MITRPTVSFYYSMEINDEYTAIAEEIIKEPDFDEVRDYASFVVLSSEEEKTKNKQVVYGECKLVPKLYKLFCPYDFLIIIYDVNAASFTPEQMRILIEHELRHMGYDLEGNEPTPYIVPHDYEEFKEIMDKYGIDWANS